MLVVFAECFGDVSSSARYYSCHCTCVLLLLEGLCILTFIVVVVVVVANLNTVLSVYLLGNRHLT